MKRFFKKTIVFGLLFGSVVLFLTTLNMISIRNDRDAYIMEFFIKREMLIEKHRRKQSSVILLGGSNVAFGFDSGMLRDSLNIPFINAGLGAGQGLKFMLDNTSKYLTEGDILVIAPEYHHFYGDNAYGNTDLAVLFIVDPSIREKFNMKQYKALICGMKNLLRDRLFPFLTIENDRRTVACFNEYGDYVKHRTMPSRPYTHASPADFNTMNTAFLDYCENAISALRNRGIQVIIIPPSFAETSYRKVEEQLIPLFSELGKRNLGFSIPPQESAYPDSLFFDTHYHLSHEGVLIRTKQLVRLMETGGFVR